MMKLRHTSSRKLPSWICLQCRAKTGVAYPPPEPPVPPVRKNISNRKTATALDSPARTRFAPSPTGYLHLGSLRTALFNYLLAKRTGGQFILRIEDTDQKRTIPGAEERLYSDLRWAGLQWDEGPNVGGPHGPYKQSQRTSIYKKSANDLVQSGRAYRCFCSAERMDALNRQRHEAGLSIGYDRKCADISPEGSEERAAKGESHVIRLKVEASYPMFYDIVFGKTGQHQGGLKKQYDDPNPVYNDPILLKSDGNPTYHLANVVDDHSMEVTHVIRGTEWLPSTPMHLALYQAFKWEPPHFGHVPLLVDENGQKLSKRDGNIDISFYRDGGIFPSTLNNYAALMGWSHSSKSDVFTLKDMEEIFSLKITKGNTIVSPEKMWFLQKAHAKRFVAEEGPEFQKLIEDVYAEVKKRGLDKEWDNRDNGTSSRQLVTSLLRHDGHKFTTPTDFVDRNMAFFTKALNLKEPYKVMNNEAMKREASESSPLSVLQTIATTLTLVPESQWTIETHHENMRSLPYTSKEVKSDIYGYLRWALLAGAAGPGIPQTMEILGRDETIRRLTAAREVNGVDAKRYKGKIKLN